MKRKLFTIILIVFVAFSVNAQLLIDEAFEDILTLPGDGWNEQNLSDPIGTLSWFQGNTSVFPPHEGAGYLAVNYNSCAGTGTISNWMLTPEINLSDGDVFSFWTRVPTGSTWADRVQVRMSLNGSSTDVGATATSVGDFDNLLLDINDTYSTNYPEVWTEFEVIISGVTGTVPGRLAFRYFVENGGPSGSNSNYVGIDLCQYESMVATAPVTFLVDNTANTSYTGFSVKGSWDAGGNFDDTWSGGNTMMYDDGTNGDVTADDDIWTAVLNLVPDAGANTWEWGVNDQDDGWIDGNWEFTVPDETAQELSYSTVGVNSISAENINIYPNPSNGTFNVNVESNYDLEVLDITGKVINFQVLTGNSTVEINTAGVYFLRFSNEEGSVTQRVIVQ